MCESSHMHVSEFWGDHHGIEPVCEAEKIQKVKPRSEFKH